jgi:hypothetical protein
MSIGSIALQGDPLIPVVKRMGTLFGLNDFKPGVLPGRLIEVAMNRYKSILQFRMIGHD